MKKIKVEATITYDDKIMYGDDYQAFLWFNKILKGNDLILHENVEIGDNIGKIKITKILK